MRIKLDIFTLSNEIFIHNLIKKRKILIFLLSKLNAEERYDSGNIIFENTLYMKAEEIKIMRGSLLGTFSNTKASAVPRYLNGYPFSSANIVCRACDLNLFLTVFSYQRTFILVLLVDVMNKKRSYRVVR